MERYYFKPKNDIVKKWIEKEVFPEIIYTPTITNRLVVETDNTALLGALQDLGYISNLEKDRTIRIPGGKDFRQEFRIVEV